jgi:phosphatidylserine decarboxylase
LSVNEKIYYIDRSDGKRNEEKIYYEKALRFLYGSFIGKCLNILVAHLPLFSHVFGWWQHLGRSKKKISPFILNYGIDATEFAEPIEAYSSFNAFFIRKLNREARPLAPGVIMPADGRYLVYQNIATCDGFIVKGKKFTLQKLLKNDGLAHRYAQAGMVIARLCPSDYHRFHFPVDCTPSSAQLINGPLYSVNPIAVKQNIELLSENKRVITHLLTEKYGTILFIEVGATNVGSIHQTFKPNQPVKKGDEKGYFSFGGSSIILLFEQETIQCASDLLKNSSEQIETLSLFGQPLGE